MKNSTIYFFRVRPPPLDRELLRPEDLLPLLRLRLPPLDLDTDDDLLLDDERTLRPEDRLRLLDLDTEPERLLLEDELLRTRVEEAGVFLVDGLRTVVDRVLGFLTRLLLDTFGRVEVRFVVRSTPVLDVDCLTRRVDGATRLEDSVDFATLTRSELSLRTLRLPVGLSTPAVLDVLPPVLPTAEPAGA